jgi:hypothetical protein
LIALIAPDVIHTTAAQYRCYRPDTVE